jgi:hypothetical protein
MNISHFYNKSFFLSSKDVHNRKVFSHFELLSILQMASTILFLFTLTILLAFAYAIV